MVAFSRRTMDQAIIVRDDVRHRHYPSPGYPFSGRYVRNHRRFLTSLLNDTTLVERIGKGDVPAGYGVGYDERVVEYPWVISQAPFGRLLDAGSVLNHAHILPRFQPHADDLTVVTLAPEARSFPERKVSYVYADLRELPFRDAAFDTVISVSTLEHVGMDNTRYGTAGTETSDPRAETASAVAELRRVLRPGGRLLITVPYGVRESFGWLRQLDAEDIRDLVHGAEPRESRVDVYSYSRAGWATADLESAAGARYGVVGANDHLATGDRAAAARAVACVRLEW